MHCEQWTDVQSQFYDGSPSDEWLSKYLWTVVCYLVFIWFNIALNPFYLRHFRVTTLQEPGAVAVDFSVISDDDINSRTGMIRQCLVRFVVISSFAYCLLMTVLCVSRYRAYTLRLDHVEVVYVLCPGMVLNAIVGGYLLKRQPGLFMMFHLLFFMATSTVIYIAFSGIFDGLFSDPMSMEMASSVDSPYFWIVSSCTFCVYLVVAVSIKAAATYHESELDGRYGVDVQCHVGG